jgi:hypothetical protein
LKTKALLLPKANLQTIASTAVGHHTQSQNQVRDIKLMEKALVKGKNKRDKYINLQQNLLIV